MRKFLRGIAIMMIIGSVATQAQPVVSGILPLYAIPNNAVTINGSGFDATPANNIVFFGATRATVSAATTTSLTVTVPYGATYSHVSVNNTTTGLTGFAQYQYIPGWGSTLYEDTLNYEYKVDFTAGGGNDLAVGDIDGDGRADVVTVNSAANTISVWKNTSTTGVITLSSLAAPVTFATQTNPSDVAIADIDGDGKLDVAVTNNTTNSVSIFRNTASLGAITAGSFAARVDITGTNAGAKGLALKDIDLDGKVDLAVTCATANLLNVFKNTSTVGTISFGPKVNFFSGSGPVKVAFGDLDGDGKQDMVSADMSANQISIFRNTSTVGAITTGSFATPVVFTMGSATSPKALCIGDMDADDKPEIVVLNSGTNNFKVFHNVATIGSITTTSFSALLDVSAGTGAVAMAMGDVFHGSNPDIVIANSGASTVSIIGNATAGGGMIVFDPPADSATGANPNSVTIADIDNDGIQDIVLANASTVSILRGKPLALIQGVPTPTVCVGSMSYLINTTPGGTWTSASPTIVSLGAVSPGPVSGTMVEINGLVAGTAVVTYALERAYTTIVVTVNSPTATAPVAGTPNVCIGATTTLSHTLSGTWASSNIAVGTVSTAGVVTGMSSGTTTITFTPTGGCVTGTTTVTVTVDVAPVAGSITGATNVCTGSTITLSSTGTGGSWSTASTVEASVDAGTGVVTGSSAGTAAITYTVTNACGAATATHDLTVNPTPTAITGTPAICVGATTTLSSTPAGGTWASGNTSIATVGTGGDVTGTGAGVTVVSYTLGSCTASTTVTVDLMPFTGTLSGAAAFCAGTDITLTSPAMGGTWASSDVSVATVGTSGIATGVSQGTATITYTNTNSCGAASTTAVVTVDVMPDPGVISGPTAVCASGSTITLTNTATTGTWSSSNPLAATISSTGIVTGVDPGTTTISYTVMNSCDTLAATLVVTVNGLPDIIGGPSVICKDETITFTSTPSGGAWSSTAPTVVSVDGTTGVITGVAPGTATISYVLVVGCYRTKSVTVNPLPAIIGGPSAVCVGSTMNLFNVNSGGTWTSGSPAVATIGSSSGIVNGISAGTTVITYARPITGCSVTKIVTVNELPSDIVGDTVICMGRTDTFSALPSGGTWSSSGPVFASVTLTTGIVSAMNAGTARITYTTPAGCKAWKLVTVNQAPSTITGSYTVCEGSTSTLGNSIPFGVWSSSNPAVGIINTSGVVAGMSPGTSSVSYTLTNGCYRAITVTINPLPAPVAGPTAVCTGTTIVLTGSPAGGTWSSSNLTVATTSGGTISGVTAGTAAISYTLSTGCKRPHVITVNPSPSNISGTAAMCVGGSVLLSSTPLTGTWISSNTAIATVGSSAGLVTGVSAGTAVITYELVGTGCRKITTATVNPLPSAISGTAAMCVGITTTLTSTPVGGTWSSSMPAIATVGMTTGAVTGIANGTATITYRTAAGCTGIRTVTVNPLADAGMVLGPPTLCVGGTVTLSATVAGGTWTTASSNISVSGTGVVTGLAPGVDTVIYTVFNSCNTATARYAMSVNPVPVIGSISGSDTICVGNASTLTVTVLGGTWSTSNSGVAIVAGGMVTGVAAGSATISYSATNACGTSSATLEVTVIPAIDAGTISGPDTVCYHNDITLTSTTPGGVWSSASLFVSVGSTTGIVSGMAPGLATIRYVTANLCSTDTAYYSVYVRYDVDCPAKVAPNTSIGNEIKLYPTPTHGVVTIETPVAGMLDVYSIDSKRIGSYRVGKNITDITLQNNIAAGIYMCRFSGEDGSTAVMKIVYEP